MATKPKLPPRLPSLLKGKIYKTGQTRGADDGVIFQNRVSRSSTVLIPYAHWDEVCLPPDGEDKFDKGYIVLISPPEYFDNQDVNNELASKGLTLGENAVIFYQRRTDWEKNNPEALGWSVAEKRIAPVGGQYVARIAATTATQGGGKISRGFNSTGMKGAGIRLFEYAGPLMIAKCRIQLEVLFWQCHDSLEAVVEFGMSQKDAAIRKEFCLNVAHSQGLADASKLVEARLTNAAGHTHCPFCLEALNARGFFHRLVQAAGREVHDLTVTEINLFHIEELRYGRYNHRVYNLGWGHHHCNVVVKDVGIEETLKWIHKIIERNKAEGQLNL